MNHCHPGIWWIIAFRRFPYHVKPCWFPETNVRAFDQLRIIAILAAFFISLFNRLEGLFHQLSLIQMVEREDPEAWKGWEIFGNANFGCLEGIRGAFMWSCHWNPTCLWCFIGKADNLQEEHASHIIITTWSIWLCLMLLARGKGAHGRPMASDNSNSSTSRSNEWPDVLANSSMHDELGILNSF